MRIEWSAYDTWIKLCAAVALSPFRRRPQAPSNAGMSLRQAVDYALAHSPDLKSAQTEVRRREGLVTTAHSFLMPQVDLSADAARSRFEHGYPAGTPPSLLRFDTTLYTGSADLKFLAWDFHKTELELPRRANGWRPRARRWTAGGRRSSSRPRGCTCSRWRTPI